MQEDFRNVCDFAQKMEFDKNLKISNIYLDIISKEKSFQTTNLALLLEVNKCMSISAVIYEPQNDFEQSFFVPIATESFFKECWQPAIEALGLQWTDLFSSGVDVEEEEVPSIIEELIQIKDWAVKNLTEEHRDKMSERITSLQNKLPLAFQRKDVVFIG